MSETAATDAATIPIPGLLESLEALRIEALAGTNASIQERLGQYFTPREAAELIAAMPKMHHVAKTVHVLDAGAGSGMLMAAMVHRLVAEGGSRSIHVTAVELDGSMGPWLEAASRKCRQWAGRHGCELTVDIRLDDFILSRTGLRGTGGQDYDIVVMNPPYAKLSANSTYRRALVAQGVDCPNLYAAFLALGADALREGGEIVAITPRSFANGPYFEQFRKYLLNTIALDRVHTFQSRSTVFSDTGVLQENIVLSGSRGGERSKVRFTMSDGHLDKATEHVVSYADLVHPGDTSFSGLPLENLTPWPQRPWHPCQPCCQTSR